MAKGVHNKTHKHNMSVKRKVMEEKVFGPRLKATSQRLFKRTYGSGDDSLITRPPNAFRYPKDPNAQYPIEEKPVYVDKRSRYLPTEYLIKSTGEKPKNREKREQDEALRRAIAESEGKLNENEPIDIDDMEGVIDDIDEMDFDESEKKSSNIKKRKEKEFGMDIDDARRTRTKINRHKMVTKSRRGKKHSKSYYIMNH